MCFGLMAGIRKRRERLKGLSPRCIFCNGNNPTSTEEHCPPKTLLRVTNDFPDRLVFPSCYKCNHETGEKDLLFSVFARTTLDPSTASDGRWLQHVNGLRGHLGIKRWNRIIDQMTVSATRQAFMAMRLGKADIKQIIGDNILVNLPEEVLESIRCVSKKLTKGLYWSTYREAFPASGSIYMHLVPNLEILTNESTVDTLSSLPGGYSLPLVKHGRDLSEQLMIKLFPTPDKSLFGCLASYYQAFIVLTVAFLNADLASQWRRTRPEGNDSFIEL